MSFWKLSGHVQQVTMMDAATLPSPSLAIHTLPLPSSGALDRATLSILLVNQRSLTHPPYPILDHCLAFSIVCLINANLHITR